MTNLLLSKYSDAHEHENVIDDNLIINYIGSIQYSGVRQTSSLFQNVSADISAASRILRQDSWLIGSRAKIRILSWLCSNFATLGHVKLCNTHLDPRVVFQHSNVSETEILDYFSGEHSHTDIALLMLPLSKETRVVLNKKFSPYSKELCIFYNACIIPELIEECVAPEQRIISATINGTEDHVRDMICEAPFEIVCNRHASKRHLHFNARASGQCGPKFLEPSDFLDYIYYASPLRNTQSLFELYPTAAPMLGSYGACRFKCMSKKKWGAAFDALWPIVTKEYGQQFLYMINNFALFGNFSDEAVFYTLAETLPDIVYKNPHCPHELKVTLSLTRV